MSRPVRLSFAARIDFLEAVEWYEFRKNGLGERFGIAIDAAFERIIRNPELFRSTSIAFAETKFGRSSFISTQAMKKS
jgi:hypothetical protein